MTVSELIASNTVAILIPFPFAIDNHQKINAQHLSLKGAGILIEEANLSPEAIENEIKLLNSEKIHKISTKLAALKVSNPEQLIADYLLH